MALANSYATSSNGVELADFESYAWFLANRYKPFLGGGDEDDVFQEAMVSAWLSITKWDGPGDGESYVMTHMKWDVLDHIRAYRGSKNAPVLVAFEDSVGPDVTFETVLERERLRTIIETVQGLSGWQRARMANRIQGLSNVQIARAEGCTVTAIDRSFWKTRRALKLALAA
jgi:RNA polymerase sigma factor (sigma-70 family)